ncbi:MAG: urease accessory protein UreE [Bacteroidales bacterium]|nr:urease accessory protein UreE [Bacteroidales bacterium]
MTVFTEIIGNLHDSQWKEKLNGVDIESLMLDQWTAQKSRFLAKSDRGNEYPVALKRHSQIIDGDIVYYNPEENKAIVLRLNLSPVLVVDLGGIKDKSPEDIIRISVELGHAIGNQHWPAVVKGTQVFVPLTVDKKVMLSVMETHHLEDIKFDFREATEAIPFLAPHEIRRLFGGAGHESHSHVHADPNMHAHIDADGHVHYHSHNDNNATNHHHHH